MKISLVLKNLLEAQHPQAKRLRSLLASLYGMAVKVDIETFVKQANDEEMNAWLELQKTVYEERFQDSVLLNYANQAKLELLKDEAFEAGRKFAYALPPEEVVEFGQEWRKSKNPHIENDLSPPEVAEAWTAGFQNALDVIAGESW